MHMMEQDCSCAPIAVFICGVRWRHSKPPNYEPHFCLSLRKDSDRQLYITRFGRCFRRLL